MIKSAYLIGRPCGIPLKIHLSLAIILLFLLFKPGGMLLALMLGASVVLHELGHSLVALRKGSDVMEIVLYPIGGMARMRNLPSNPKDEFLVAVAGPGVSLLLAGAALLLSLGWGTLGIGGLMMLLIQFGAINLMLALFNLIPAFPMDGGRILRAWLSRRKGRLEATRLAAKTGRIFAVIFGIIGLLYGQITLMIIAAFIYFAAGGEYRQVMMQEGLAGSPFEAFFRAQQTHPAARDEPFDVHVSPPPYAKKTPAGGWLKRLDAWLDRKFNP